MFTFQLHAFSAWVLGTHDLNCALILRFFFLRSCCLKVGSDMAYKSQVCRVRKRVLVTDVMTTSWSQP